MSKEIWNSVNRMNAVLMPPISNFVKMPVLPPEILTALNFAPSTQRIIHPLCNNGRELLWLWKRGFSGIGIDFSPVAIKAAKEYSKSLNSNLAFHYCDVNKGKLRLESDYFHSVLLTLGSLMWIKDPHTFISRCNFVLKSGGILVVWDFHPDLLFGDCSNSSNYDRANALETRFSDGIDSYFSRSSFSNGRSIEKKRIHGKDIVQYYICGLQRLKRILEACGFRLKLLQYFYYIFGEAWNDEFVSDDGLHFRNPYLRHPSSFVICAQKI